MITDNQTNFVYFSQILADKYTAEWERVTSILNKHGVKHGLLQGTKDIWCMDYMPIQLSKNKFMGYRYEPSYLKDPKYIHTQSNPKQVCDENNIRDIQFSNLNLDGGNVVRWNDRVMISDRVFDENMDLTETQVIDHLEKTLNAEVIIIPQIKCDMTGHSDGMVRFVNRDTILVNELEYEYKYWRLGIEKVISKYNFNYFEVPWFEPKEKKSISAIGCYINFLEVGNLILLPRFYIEEKSDEKALTLFKQVFEGRIIETVEVNKIAEEGGVLNCITWNIQK
jgi:agmatine deiminase